MFSLQNMPQSATFMCTQAIFLLDLMGWFAAHDVRDEWNFLASEITLLEPRPLLDGHRLITRNAPF